MTCLPLSAGHEIGVPDGVAVEEPVTVVGGRVLGIMLVTVVEVVTVPVFVSGRVVVVG